MVHVHAVSPERDALEISFRRVAGYRADFPRERIDIDLSRLDPYVLDPDRVKAATNVTMAGIVGARHTLDLEHWKDQRLSAQPLP